MAAGEHLYHLDAFRALLEASAVDVLILDLARVGGVTPWRKIAALAHAHRVPVCGHVVPEIQVHLLASSRTLTWSSTSPARPACWGRCPGSSRASWWRRPAPASASSSTNAPCAATA